MWHKGLKRGSSEEGRKSFYFYPGIAWPNPRRPLPRDWLSKELDSCHVLEISSRGEALLFTGSADSRSASCVRLLWLIALDRETASINSRLVIVLCMTTNDIV